MLVFLLDITKVDLNIYVDQSFLFLYILSFAFFSTFLYFTTVRSIPPIVFKGTI